MSRHTGELEQFRDNYVQNMERMFAAVSDLYAGYWHDFFHFALFEDDAGSGEQAIDRTHRRYLEALRIDGAQSALDLACRRGGFSMQGELILQPFMRYWGVPSLESPGDYRRHFEAAGLRLIEEEDLNEKVRRKWELGYERSIEAVQDVSQADLGRLLWKGLRLGEDGMRLIKEQFPAALYIKAGFDSGFLQYVLFVTEKP